MSRKWIREIQYTCTVANGQWVFVALLVSMAILATPVTAIAKIAPESFADLAERSLPAVVNIATTQVIKRQDRPDRPQFPPGSPFEEFFRDFFERQQRPDAPPRRSTSLGSGFVIDPAGYIVTNNHVIKDADEIIVRFQDDHTLEAKIVGRDPKTDLAILKVESDKPLVALKFGDSRKSRVGDWVIAIGNPFGLGGTVTAGIISARQRDINSGPYDDFLQTDASINRGNSGGPMLNLDGDVIGINTAIFTPTGGSVGIGFAVPSSLAAPVIQQLREFGQTRRGWLGVRIQSVTSEIADSLGLKEPRGALVASVAPGGPAEKAGLEAGDVVLTFDGKQVEKMRRLPRIVAETPIGREVKVEVWRKGEMRDLAVVVGELEETEQVAAKPGEETKPLAAEVKSLGLALATLTPELRARYELAEDVDGVVVTEVDVNGSSSKKGIQAGDLVVEVNQDAVSSPNDVIEKVEAASESGRKSVLLLMSRKGDLRFVAVTISAG